MLHLHSSIPNNLNHGNDSTNCNLGSVTLKQLPVCVTHCISVLWLSVLLPSVFAGVTLKQDAYPLITTSFICLN